MFEAVGHEVIHLRRTTLGPLTLKELPLGQWRELTEREVNELKGSVGLGVPRGARVAARVEQQKARRGSARFETPAREESAGFPASATRRRPTGAGPGGRKVGFRKNRDPR
jgi:hypothetical protein